jgi:hypothetical protein
MLESLIFKNWGKIVELLYKNMPIRKIIKNGRGYMYEDRKLWK